jgi:glycosyltransferase involved in cell wall biosynthesis
MPDPSIRLAICIPTFRRAGLLRRLLADLGRQTISPDRLIIVDGDPASGEVPQTLMSLPPLAGELLYVPSNHANLPYQRFLGWKAAADAAWLLYLDDDLLVSRASVERLVHPLGGSFGRVVGVTAEFDTATWLGGAGLDDGKPRPAPASLIGRFGSSRDIPAGELGASGHRRPIAYRGRPYEVVGCLRGGAMAFLMSAITQDCFCDALFALYERGCGGAEDTLLSRRVGSRGILLTAFGAGIVHPADHATVAGRHDSFGRGYATAYSRRLLNDHFRGFAAPRWKDRIALVKSYMGNVALAWLRGLHDLDVIRGLLDGPASRRLTPEIDWWSDSQAALAQARTFTPALAGFP